MSQINPDSPSYHTMQEAAEWFVTLNDPEVTEHDKARWQLWLQNSENAQAWQLVEKVHQRFSMTEHNAGRQSISHSLKAAQKDRISRRQLLQNGSLLGLAGWICLQYTPLRSVPIRLSADQISQTGEIKSITLQDGSMLWLNTASAINTLYNTQQRQIELLAGEILIQTIKDPLKREFSVSTAQGLIRALGTRFTVREKNDHIFVAVYEGAVEIRTRSGQTQHIPSGQQTWFSANTLAPVTPADPARQIWSEGLIVANDIPLRELADELSRYRMGYLGVAPEVENLNVIGTFPVNKPDHALSMLEDSLSVKIHAPFPWWVSIDKK